MATTPAFVPVQPRRVRDWVSPWRGFFGERLRNTIYGWPEPAFDLPIRTRKVLGFTVHIVSGPAAVERVLLGNKANYKRPAIARRILKPLMGNGLLAAEDEDWRIQRKIVAPTFAPGAVAAMAGLMDAAALREVATWPWVIHRHRALWPDPDRFDHTRFTPEAKAKLHRFQYLPFGGGPRVCVGMRFATLEALLVLARWLAARRLALPEGWKPDPFGAVTLRPRGGMILRAELL